MKKYFYFISCLLVGMTLSFSSCGGDDPISDGPGGGTTTPTPEPEPTPDPKPEEGTLLDAYIFELNYERELGHNINGDSIAFYGLVKDKVKHMQDSVKEAGASLVIDYSEEARTICFYDTKNTEGAIKTGHRNFLTFLRNQRNVGFVCTGDLRQTSCKIKLADNTVLPGTSHMSIRFHIPNFDQTTWSTEFEGPAEIQSIKFIGNTSLVAYLNGDEHSSGYNVTYDGYDVTLKKDAAVYMFKLNETGTEMKLTQLNGEEVTKEIIYTCSEFASQE